MNLFLLYFQQQYLGWVFFAELTNPHFRICFNPVQFCVATNFSIKFGHWGKGLQLQLDISGAKSTGSNLVSIGCWKQTKVSVSGFWSWFWFSLWSSWFLALQGVRKSKMLLGSASSIDVRSDGQSFNVLHDICCSSSEAPLTSSRSKESPGKMILAEFVVIMKMREIMSHFKFAISTSAAVVLCLLLADKQLISSKPVFFKKRYYT